MLVNFGLVKEISPLNGIKISPEWPKYFLLKAICVSVEYYVDSCHKYGKTHPFLCNGLTMLEQQAEKAWCDRFFLNLISRINLEN